MATLKKGGALLTAQDKEDFRAGIGFDGSVDDPTTVAFSSKTTSGIGDYSLDNTLHIFVGDSTTEQMQSAGGGADTAKAYRQVGGPLEKVIGMINFGGSGYTLFDFVNDAAIPGFTGPSIGAEVGILQWDSWLHKPVGAVSQATTLAWRSQYPQYKTIWSVCFGINDLILRSANGNLTQQGIADYIVPLLRTAVSKIKAAWPQDLIILRVPNPMTFQPYNAQFPSATEYPTFDTPGNEANSRALVEKWNQALRSAYLTVQGEFSRCVLQDTWEDVFGTSNTNLTAATQLPNLGDRVHPSVQGYTATIRSYVRLLAPKYEIVTPRKIEAESRATLLGNNAWENYSKYFDGNPAYKEVLKTELVAIGSSYIDVAVPLATWQKYIFGAVYIVINGVAAQYFATYNAIAQGNNTRLLSVSPSAVMQTGTQSFKLTIYQDSGISLLANDGYVHTQASAAKEAFSGKMSTCGNGFIRIQLSALNGRMSAAFLDGALFGKIAVGGIINTVIDFTAGGWSRFAQDVANNIIQFNKAGTDYTSYSSQPAALFFGNSYPSPKSYERARLSGTTDATIGTQTSIAHDLGYTPVEVQITPKGNGVVYISANSDATNIYVKGGAASIPFDAYVR